MKACECMGEGREVSTQGFLLAQRE